jgi:hypothetical protein
MTDSHLTVADQRTLWKLIRRAMTLYGDLRAMTFKDPTRPRVKHESKAADGSLTSFIQRLTMEKPGDLR